MIILLQREKNEDFTGNLFKVATNNQAIRTWHQGGMKDIRFKKDYFRSSDYVNSMNGDHQMAQSTVTPLLISRNGFDALSSCSSHPTLALLILNFHLI